MDGNNMVTGAMTLTDNSTGKSVELPVLGTAPGTRMRMRVKFRFCKGNSRTSPGWKVLSCSEDTVFTSDAVPSTLTLSVTAPSSRA